MKKSELKELIKESIKEIINESTLVVDYNGKSIGWDKDKGYFWGTTQSGDYLQTTDKRKIELIKKKLESLDVKKELSESKLINEVVDSTPNPNDPKVIADIRDAVKGYRNVLDPKTKQKYKMDSFTASAIIQVYDALENPAIKDKMANMPILIMQKIALQMIK